MEHPGRSGAKPGPPDWIVQGRTRYCRLELPRRRKEYDKTALRNGASEKEQSKALAPGLDRPGENPVPWEGATEATGRIRQKDAPDWSIRGGVKRGPSPRTGSSGGEPGDMDWSLRGGRGNMAKSPGVHPVQRTGTPGDAMRPDWDDRGRSGPGMEGPGQQPRRRRQGRSDTERRTRTRARNRRGRTRRREDAKGEEQEQEGRRRRRGGGWAHGRMGTWSLDRKDQSGGDEMAARGGKSKERRGGRTRRTRARGKRRRGGRKSGLTRTETRMPTPGAPRGQEDGGRKKEEGSQGEHAQEQARMRGGDRKHARSTQRARAPVNRSQEAQDAAHTPPQTTLPHR